MSAGTESSKMLQTQNLSLYQSLLRAQIQRVLEHIRILLRNGNSMPNATEPFVSRHGAPLNARRKLKIVHDSEWA